ncbi:MAG: S-adenosylmethionine:tRNA ribosyltransferase-isomerase, partial [Acidobacteriota bacterium]
TTAELVASGRPVVALGTTALRALESYARTGTRSGTTELFLYPGCGHAFATPHLITNFHLPESTLLMLVCAFAGTERVLAAYRHAVAARYRFFSYGDAMLVHRC